MCLAHYVPYFLMAVRVEVGGIKGCKHNVGLIVRPFPLVLVWEPFVIYTRARVFTEPLKHASKTKPKTTGFLIIISYHILIARRSYVSIMVSRFLALKSHSGGAKRRSNAQRAERNAPGEKCVGIHSGGAKRRSNAQRAERNAPGEKHVGIW